MASLRDHMFTEREIIELIAHARGVAQHSLERNKQLHWENYERLAHALEQVVRERDAALNIECCGRKDKPTIYDANSDYGIAVNDKHAN